MIKLCTMSAAACIATAVALGAGTAVVGMAGPVSAASATPVTIDARASFDSPVGTFTASGASFCESGTTSTSPGRVVGSNTAITFHLTTTLTCADGSGSVTLRIQARVQPCDATDAGAWVVAGGTGEYERLRGAGTLVGTYFPGDVCGSEGIVDHFTGHLAL
jgi:hypothetical protein